MFWNVSYYSIFETREMMTHTYMKNLFLVVDSVCSQALYGHLSQSLIHSAWLTLFSSYDLASGSILHLLIRYSLLN